MDTNIFDYKRYGYAEGLADKLPSLIQATFMYAYPDESFQSIVYHYISDVELRGGSVLDPHVFVLHSICLVADYRYGEWPKFHYERTPDYILTFQIGSITYSVTIIGRHSIDINILRLSMFLYLIANENCIPGFNHNCPIWFYDPYNLEAVTSVLSEDVSKGYYDVLKGYISYMDKFDMEIDDIIEACHKFGHNELLMVIMRMLGTAEKKTVELRL